MSNTALAPAFDFCAFQRFVNNIGGAPEFPSYANAEPQFKYDRLAQYGFEFWSDMVAHIVEGYHWRFLDHPPLPGVYAITTVACDYVNGSRIPKGAEHLLYIGSAKNISKRLAHPEHWIHEIMRRLHNGDVAVVTRVLLTKDYMWAEKSLIRTLRPLLNIHHNGKAIH